MSKQTNDFHNSERKSKLDHEQSDVKNTTRLALIGFANLLNFTNKKIKIVTLGGKRFLLEKLLTNLGVTFKGISFEMDKDVYKTALKNKPENVKLENANIYSYKYMANETVIWFDLMCFLDTYEINKLIDYIRKSDFRHSFIFAFTFTVDPRRDQYGISKAYLKAFPNYKETGVVDHISTIIEQNKKVHVTDSLILHYHNKDVSVHAMKMGAYFLKIEKI